MSVHIFATPRDLAEATASHISTVIEESHRVVTLGLAGGSTPAATYESLAKRSVDWSKVIMWLGDERWVPHDHSESNTRMIRKTLVDAVVGRLLAPDTAFGEPASAAAEYAGALTEVFHDGRPDVVLLGMGHDGHTASLFPGTAALESDAGTYLANWVDEKDSWRLTASLPLLWSAREIVFLVQGKNKASVLAQIIDEGHPYPAQRVASGADSVRWMVDSAAASQLRSVPR
jgi:6-phosphogluconolactonase